MVTRSVAVLGRLLLGLTTTLSAGAQPSRVGPQNATKGEKTPAGLYPHSLVRTSFSAFFELQRFDGQPPGDESGLEVSGPGAQGTQHRPILREKRGANPTAVARDLDV
jgi:hypothetical protein